MKEIPITFAELKAADLPVCLLLLGKKGQVRFATMITGPTKVAVPGFGPGKIDRTVMVNVRGEVTETSGNSYRPK